MDVFHNTFHKGRENFFFHLFQEKSKILSTLKISFLQKSFDRFQISKT